MLKTVRTANGVAGQALRAEADLLRDLNSAAVAGVPTLVDVTGDLDGNDDTTTILTTATPPGIPLADRLPLSAQEAVGVTIAVARLVHDLDTHGVGFSAVPVAEIHLAGGVQPTLRTLSGASTGSMGAAGPLGRLLLTLLPPPSRWRLRPDPVGAARALAIRAGHEERSAGDFAAALQAACPDTRLPRPTAPGSRQRHARRAAVGLMAAAAAAVVIASATAVIAGGDAKGNADERPVTAESQTTPTTPAGAVWPKHGCDAVDGPTIDLGEECPTPLIIGPSTVSAGSRRWAIGDGDYALVVGDWRCTGEVSVAALDLDSGDVWLLDLPPHTGDPTVGEWVGSAPGATGLTPAEGGCQELRAFDEHGDDVAIDRDQP